MKPILYIIRGLPGSGKSTLAKKLVNLHFENDQFFMKRGVYDYDESLYEQAKEVCYAKTAHAMLSGKDIAVSNVFPKKKSYAAYIKLAKANNYTVIIYDCYAQLRNIHGTNNRIQNEMRRAWEPVQNKLSEELDLSELYINGDLIGIFSCTAAALKYVHEHHPDISCSVLPLGVNLITDIGGCNAN